MSETILVTGGTGFLGHKIIEMLLERNYKVIALVRKKADKLEKLGAKISYADLTNFEDTKKACQNKNITAVIHCAAKSGIWGAFYKYIESNIIATVNILAAAKENNIKYFVQTSSPSVTHCRQPLINADELTPYTANYNYPYPYTKMIAEQITLNANTESFKTVSLRPHLIWGPGDPHFLPRFSKRAKKKTLILFSPDATVDATYIDNAAYAHILALEALMNKKENVAGEAFFIAQGEPLTIKDLINKMLKATACPPVTTVLPTFIGSATAWFIEKIWQLFNIKREPPITKFAVEQMTQHHFFSLEKAKKYLNYKTIVSVEEGLAKMEEESKKLNKNF